MSLKREFGKEQPYIPAGPFKIRFPFVHWDISGPEVLVGLTNTICSLVACATFANVLGVDTATARAMIIISSSCYLLNWLLGDPAIGGWITPALAIVSMYLEGYEMGAARFSAMSALQLEVAIIFIFFGITGLANKIVGLVPPALKGGIIMGAAVAAVETGMKNYFPKGQVTVGIGVFIMFFLLYSQRFKDACASAGKGFLKFVSRYTFAISCIITMIVAGILGDADYSGVSLFPLFQMPDFNAVFSMMSPLYIGFPDAATWLKAIPTALAVYIIAFGDFVTIKELARSSAREDEFIDTNTNRSHLVCGFRNLIMGLLVPFPQLCGPVSAPYVVSTYARYKEQGREGLDNVWSGFGTITLIAIIFMFMPVSMSLAAPASFCVMGLLMLIQGYTCTQVAFNCCHDKMDIGIAGMMTGIMCIKGGAWSMVCGILFYFVLTTSAKIKNDHQINLDEIAADEKAAAEALAK